MKKKNNISFATTVTTLILFFMLTSVKEPFLFFSAFILLVAKGVKMYVDMIGESYELSENQPKENLNKLLAVRFSLQLIPLHLS